MNKVEFGGLSLLICFLEIFNFGPGVYLKGSCPFTQLIRPITYKAMTLYPNIKSMASYPNKSFEKNFRKNGLIQAKLNLLDRKTENG